MARPSDDPEEFANEAREKAKRLAHKAARRRDWRLREALLPILVETADTGNPPDKDKR